MRILIDHFFALNLEIRAAILLALLIVIFWWMLGRKLLWVASVLPYLLRKIFRYVYILIEIPVCFIHKKLGTSFYKLDNGMSGTGQIVDSFFEKWYQRWHNARKKYIIFSLIIYFILIFWICAPFGYKKEAEGFLSGKNVYLELENGLLGLLKKYNWYQEKDSIAYVSNQPDKSAMDATIAEEQKVSRDIMLIVSTAYLPLDIRDVPSVEDCEILAQADKGSIVVWRGDMAFGPGDSGHIEPWVKVETGNGIIGWARLNYLCPQNLEDFEMTLRVE